MTLCECGCGRPARLRFLRGHNSRSRHTPHTRKPEAERFWAKVLKDESGCWIWTARLNPQGYGMFRRAGAPSCNGAHVWAYQDRYGDIPRGLHLDHLCRNRACVNPEHLEPVTARENIVRGISFAAINAAKTHCVHGHEFTPENTYLGGKERRRQCRQCQREAVRRYQARRSAA